MKRLISNRKNWILFFLGLSLTLLNSCDTPPVEAKNKFERIENKCAEQLQKLLTRKGIDKNQFTIFIRAFKKERILEVWAKNENENTYQALIEYPFCEFSGILGPKRKEGDRQIPEGLYYIQRYNINSSYHLSLGINYPNPSDKILGDAQQPGSDIFIHGKCVTIGCIPLTDPKIEELYILASWTRKNGTQKIPVHIFPAKMETPIMQSLTNTFPQHQKFWEELRPFYQYFEKKHQLPSFSISKNGTYKFSDE